MRDEFEFRSIMKSLEKGDVLSKRLEVAVKGHDDEKRMITFVFSTGTADRKGDTINNNGWDIDDFNKNPVFLWQHDLTEQPLGKIEGLRVEEGNLVGDVEFWFSDRSPELWSDFDKKADSIYEQYKRGFLKGASVRFAPLDFTPSTENENGINYEKQYLLEISAVSVPDNADALSVETIKLRNKKPESSAEDFANALAGLLNN